VWVRDSAIRTCLHAPTPFRGGCRAAETVRLSSQRGSWTSKPAPVRRRADLVSSTHANAGMRLSSSGHHCSRLLKPTPGLHDRLTDEETDPVRPELQQRGRMIQATRQTTRRPITKARSIRLKQRRVSERTPSRSRPDMTGYSAQPSSSGRSRLGVAIHQGWGIDNRSHRGHGYVRMWPCVHTPAYSSVSLIAPTSMSCFSNSSISIATQPRVHTATCGHMVVWFRWSSEPKFADDLESVMPGYRAFLSPAVSSQGDNRCRFWSQTGNLTTRRDRNYHIGSLAIDWTGCR